MNGKTKEELNQIIEWFTGFDNTDIQISHKRKSNF